MSGVLPEGTDVGYYVGGKVIVLFLVSQFFRPVQMLFCLLTLVMTTF